MTSSKIWCLRVASVLAIFSFSMLWLGSPAEAQVRDLKIEPANTAPVIEVLNDGKAYKSMAPESIEFPVNISASCAPRSRVGSYYLISNSSEKDFANQQVEGTIGLGELGFMLVFRPTVSSTELSMKEQVFKVPLRELYSGENPVPVQICNELLSRKTKSGMARTTVLAKDWKIIQPLSLSFMPSCARGKTEYWSKLSTTQLVNYMCKASKVAVTAEAKRIASESKRDARAEKVQREAARKQAELEARKRAAAQQEAERKRKEALAKKEAERKQKEALAKKEEKIVVASTKQAAVTKPEPEPERVLRTAPKLSITAVPQQYTGECPALIAFKGKIVAAKKGLIKFHFQDGDQAEATRAVNFKKKDHSQSFQTQALFEQSKIGSMKLVVEGPQAEHAETAYSVVCQN